MTTVVIGTYNRGHLLERSLWAYKDCRVIVMDDDSDDNTEKICSWHSNVFYLKLPPKNGVWRDSSKFLNQGIKIALNDFNSDHVFITHPEIIPGRDTIKDCVLLSGENIWVNAKGYYLSQHQQSLLDTVNWREDLLNVRKLPDFYNAPSVEFEGRDDYRPESIDRIGIWHSWIFGGGSKEMWRNFGGITEFETWGSIDVDLHSRREKLNMQTATPKSEHAIVVHQNHDNPDENILTPRDMTKCMAALPDYNIINARKPELLA